MFEIRVNWSVLSRRQKKEAVYNLTVFTSESMNFPGKKETAFVHTCSLSVGGDFF